MYCYWQTMLWNENKWLLSAIAKAPSEWRIFFSILHYYYYLACYPVTRANILLNERTVDVLYLKWKIDRNEGHIEIIYIKKKFSLWWDRVVHVYEIKTTNLQWLNKSFAAVTSLIYFYCYTIELILIIASHTHKHAKLQIHHYYDQ